MIRVSEPVLGDRELEYVTECLQSGWVSSAGPFVEAFEERWAEYCGRRYGVAVSNGTAALEVAVACLRLSPGDEVILPTFTIISCVLAVVRRGAVPVLVDADARTWCMDVSMVESKVGPRTRAIMPVHIYGHPVDMDPLLTLAEHHGLAIVEDAAEAHGAQYLSRRESDSPQWRVCGGMGSLGVFSFYANKLVTTGEGGMVVTDDAELRDRARSLRDLLRARGAVPGTEGLGFNFRLTNLQAAVGLAQIERLAEIIALKRRIAEEYAHRLREVEGLQLPVQETWARSVFWMYGVVVAEETGKDAARVAEALHERGVDTRPFFLGMHEQPVLRGLGIGEGEPHPVAERLARQGLYLPSGAALTENEIEQVCGALRDVMRS